MWPAIRPVQYSRIRPRAAPRPCGSRFGVRFGVRLGGCLIGLVVNALLFLLTSWVAGKLSLPFHITGFWAAFWGAIIVGVVGWALNLIFDDHRKPERA